MTSGRKITPLPAEGREGSNERSKFGGGLDHTSSPFAHAVRRRQESEYPATIFPPVSRLPKNFWIFPFRLRQTEFGSRIADWACCSGRFLIRSLTTLRRALLRFCTRLVGENPTVFVLRPAAFARPRLETSSIAAGSRLPQFLRVAGPRYMSLKSFIRQLRVSQQSHRRFQRAAMSICRSNWNVGHC